MAEVMKAVTSPVSSVLKWTEKNIHRPGLKGLGLTKPDFLKKKGGAAAPTVTAPTAMPDPEAQAKAKKRSLQKQLGRGGRASTVLSDSGTKLGG